MQTSANASAARLPFNREVSLAKTIKRLSSVVVDLARENDSLRAAIAALSANNPDMLAAMAKLRATIGACDDSDGEVIDSDRPAAPIAAQDGSAAPPPPPAPPPGVKLNKDGTPRKPMGRKPGSPWKASDPTAKPTPPHVRKAQAVSDRQPPLPGTTTEADSAGVPGAAPATTAQEETKAPDADKAPVTARSAREGSAAAQEVPAASDAPPAAADTFTGPEAPTAPDTAKAKGKGKGKGKASK